MRVERKFNSMLDENRRDPAFRSTAVGSEALRGSVEYPLNSVTVEENKENVVRRQQDQVTPPS